MRVAGAKRGKTSVADARRADFVCSSDWLSRWLKWFFNQSPTTDLRKTDINGVGGGFGSEIG